MSKEKKILITGGAGFIGSHVVDKLLHDGNTVLCIDDFNDFYNPSIKRTNIQEHLKYPNYFLEEFDIRDYLKIDECIKAYKPEVVVHLAARAGVRPSIREPFLYESVNVTGTLNLLQSSVNSGVKKFIFASSSSVYGSNAKTPFSEGDALLSPISPYAATKIAGESLCHCYSHLYKLPIIALRFFTVFGPRQRPDLAIYKFVQAALGDKPLSMYGKGDTRRDYTYIDDIVAGIIASLDFQPKYFEVFNLGNSRTVSLRELLDTIQKTIGKKIIIDILPEQPGDVPLTYADIKKAKKILGYCPTTELETGIKLFCEWFISKKD